jgi:hypothetical protein
MNCALQTRRGVLTLMVLINTIAAYPGPYLLAPVNTSLSSSAAGRATAVVPSVLLAWIRSFVHLISVGI